MVSRREKCVLCWHSRVTADVLPTGHSSLGPRHSRRQQTNEWVRPRRLPCPNHELFEWSPGALEAIDRRFLVGIAERDTDDELLLGGLG